MESNNFWNVDKSVKRLVYRLAPKENGDYFQFKPNIDDFNALKSVLGSLDRDKKINVQNNTLLAKLYIYHLTMEIRHSQTTVLNDLPQKKISNLLSRPLDVFVKAFYNDLQDNQLNKLVEFDKINQEILKDIENAEKDYPKHNGITSKEDYINNKKKSIISEDKQLEIINQYQDLKKTFTLEFVEGKLFDMINKALKRFS